MNITRAIRTIFDVALQFDVIDDMENELAPLRSKKVTSEEYICSVGLALGLSRKDLEEGKSTIPNAVYNKYSVFKLLSEWRIGELLAEENGHLHFLKAVFGDKANIEVSSKAKEQEGMLRSVRERCDHKVAKINELFPESYPINLPVWQFSVWTERLIDFPKVKELSESYDTVVQRFHALFFAAVKADLPKSEILELNLLATFLKATDAYVCAEKVSYDYIVRYRNLFQEDRSDCADDYVRIRRSIPVWKAREFYMDDSFVENYIVQHTDVKRLVREFLTRVANYECQYCFINHYASHLKIQAQDLDKYIPDALDDEELDDKELAPYIHSDPILISKKENEISETDKLIVERGQMQVGAKQMGGFAAPEEKRPVDGQERMIRMQKRMLFHLEQKRNMKIEKATGSANAVAEAGEDVE